MTTPTAQEVEAAGRDAYNKAALFVGLPTIEDQVAAAVAPVQAALTVANAQIVDVTGERDTAQTALDAANATLAKTKDDQALAQAAEQKVTDDLGGS